MSWLKTVCEGLAKHGPFLGTLIALYSLTVWVIYWFSKRMIEQKDSEIEYLRQKLEELQKLVLAKS
jgi:hypothetical protein